MTDNELVNWCIENNMPTKMAALLSIWTPDYDELDDWDISLIDNNTLDVNGDRYIVYTDSEQLDIIIKAEEQMQEDILVPEYLVDYIDWCSYWEDIGLTLSDILNIPFEEIIFQLDTFYYAHI